MCSLTINNIADKVELDSKSKAKIEERMIALAKDSSVQHRGALDNIAGMTRMPPLLKDIKKKTVGRHRVYYFGHHSQCCFHIFYIKPFKKSRVDDEDMKRFQRILISAKSNSSYRSLN